MEDLTFRFLAPHIEDAIYGKYFDGIKRQGMLDPKFLKRINGTMVCLTCAILCHSLQALQTGAYKKLSNFNPEVVEGGILIIACFLMPEWNNHEKRKIFLSGSRPRGGGSPGRCRTCFY